MFHRNRHFIIKTKRMNKNTKRVIRQNIRIRNKYWKEYESIKPEVKKLMVQWKIDNGYVDEEGNPINIKGQCYQEWIFEKRLMRQYFDVDWPTIQDLNPMIMFD